MKIIREKLKLIIFLALFLFVAPNLIQPAQAATCSTGSTVAQGGTLSMSGSGFGGNSLPIGIVDGFGGQDTPLFNVTGGADPFNIVIGIPTSVQIGTWRAYVNAGGFGKVFCSNTFNVTAGGGGGSNPNLGTINPAQGIPSAGGDPSTFVANLIRSSISLLIIVAFIIDLIWTIFAGIRFVTAGGDPKSVGTAWSQIYWGLIGMVVVVGSFAIIKMVETFFNVSIISGGFKLPTI